MKTRYKLIVEIGYKELHFEFAYLPNVDSFIQSFYAFLLMDEEDAKEVKMHIEVVATPIPKPVTTEDESEGEE